MPESGGPTTQAGINYQNSIAALYLGRMLDLGPRPARDRVIKVRVEAPANVDDIHVWFADGSKKYIQAKTKIKASGKAWTKLWTDFLGEHENQSSEQSYSLSLTLSENNQLSANLRETVERARSSGSFQEFLDRLTKPQNKIFNNIADLISLEPELVAGLLAKVEIEVFPYEQLERDYAPNWMPRSSHSAQQLFSILRDHCAKFAAQRAIFQAETLREYLKSEHSIDIFEPEFWGADIYRGIIRNDAVVAIPGTNFSRLIDESFPWPFCTPYDANHKPELEDEFFIYDQSTHNQSVDLRLFPQNELKRTILIGGAGFGKSLAAKAISCRLAEQGKLPVTIKLPNFAKADLTIDDYLGKIINREYSVEINWRHAADAGRVVLILDGLDEIAPASRQIFIERLRVYSARYPLTPWLLTVRDPTAINTSMQGYQVEIKALDDYNLEQIIKFYRPESAEYVESFVRRLNNRPDLSLLTRIPLFLALLCTTTQDLSKLPASRSELLEEYLSLILKPETHKISEAKPLDSVRMRALCEKIAFAALERDQIGVDERTLLRIIQESEIETGVDEIADSLIKCGMLKRGGTRTLYFPFPIIQEYLAGCYIAEERPETIIPSIENVIKKPWAQSLQFAIERTDSTAEIIADALNSEDDAFMTRTRLIARCVANGMPCPSDLKPLITDRLVSFWGKAGWHIKKRIGQTIADAFYDPVTDDLRDALHDRYFLHDGLGDIVVSVNDSELTFDILKTLTTNGDTHLLNLGEFQQALNQIAIRAFDFYVELAENPNESPLEDDDLDTMLSCLTEHLDASGISKTKITSAANNEDLPLAFRLACHNKIKSKITDATKELIDLALAIDSFQPRSAAINLLSKNQMLGDVLHDFMAENDGTEESWCKFLDSVPTQDSPDFHLTLIEDQRLPAIIRDRSLVFAARYGSQDAMEKLLNEAKAVDSEIFIAALSLLGHFPSRDLALKAAEGIKDKNWPKKEKISIASALRTGLTSVFEMDFFNGGALEYCPLHIGAPLFEPLLEEWALSADFTPREQLSYDLSLAHIGYLEASSRIHNNLLNLLALPDIDLTEWDDAHPVSDALRYLQREGIFLPVDTIEEVIRKSTYNTTTQCYSMLSMIGTSEALDVLIWAHNREKGFARKQCLSAVEKISSRLGVKILDKDHKLVVV